MKFYGNGIVWDKNKNKRLCKFTKGTFETTDNYIIDVLIKSGYKEEINAEFKKEIETIEEIQEEGIEYNSLGIRQLKEIAKENGFTGYTNKTKQQIIKMLEGE